MRRLSGDTWTGTVETAGTRGGEPFGRSTGLSRSRDVKVSQIPTTEGTAGNEADRELDDGISRTVWSVTMYGVASPHGDPQEALGVHSHTVRHA